MSQVTEQSVRFQTALASIKLIQASAVLDLTEDDFDFLTSNKVWIATDRSRARRCVEACVYGTLDFVGYPRFPAPIGCISRVIAYYVHPVNIQTACRIMEGAEFTENIINGVERPVKAAELFAFTMRVRAGNTDVLTDAEENVRQKIRAEGVMECLKVKNVLALALIVRSRCEVLKASVRRSSLVCRWSTILIAGASAPYLRINYVYYSNWRRAYAACPFPSWLPCWSDWSSYYHFNYSGYRWRLLRDGRRWRSPSFSIASWPCY